MKRLLILLLSAAMVIALMPAMVLADSGIKTVVNDGAKNIFSDMYGISDNGHLDKALQYYPKYYGELLKLMNDTKPEVGRNALNSAAADLGYDLASNLRKENNGTIKVANGRGWDYLDPATVTIEVKPYVRFMLDYAAESRNSKTFTLQSFPSYEAYLLTSDGKKINYESADHSYDYGSLSSYASRFGNIEIKVPVPEGFGEEGKAYVEHNGAVSEGTVLKENNVRILTALVSGVDGLFTFSEGNPPATVAVETRHVDNDGRETFEGTEEYVSLQEAVNAVPSWSEDSDPETAGSYNRIKVLSDTELRGKKLFVPDGKTVLISVYENSPENGSYYRMRRHFVAGNGYRIRMEDVEIGGLRNGYKVSSVTGKNIHFGDVSEDAWYSDAVDWAVDRGVTSGTGDGTFSPDAFCTRGQMAVFLWRMKGEPKVSGKQKFSDVAADSYYSSAIEWAAENGITAGVSNTAFRPDDPCTRGQMAVFLWRIAGEPDLNPYSDHSQHFSDVKESSYYAHAIDWLQELSITSGTGGTTFSPDNACTRAQMVTFLYRASNYTFFNEQNR